MKRGAYRLVRIDGRLELHDDVGSAICLQVDDVRRRARQGRKLALAKACGLRPNLHVLDGMAGLGLDGITLAALGCNVVMIERDPLLFALLEDAVERSRAQLAIAGTIECWNDDVRNVLAVGGTFDTIYLDPMFSGRSKQALPRKSTQVLIELVGPPDDDLVDVASRCVSYARLRVVVKRRRHDAPVARPDWQILGRSVRFDVYRGGAPGEVA